MEPILNSLLDESSSEADIGMLVGLFEGRMNTIVLTAAISEITETEDINDVSKVEFEASAEAKESERSTVELEPVSDNETMTLNVHVSVYERSARRMAFCTAVMSKL